MKSIKIALIIILCLGIVQGASCMKRPGEDSAGQASVKIARPTVVHIHGELTQAIESGNVALIQELIKRHGSVNVTEKCGCTPLALAVDKGNKEIVSLLLDAGAQINACFTYLDVTNHTALEIAVNRADKEMVELLIRKGAHLNYILIAALRSRIPNKEIVTLLLEAGAPVNISVTRGNTQGITPLMYAVSYAKDLVALLLEKGADVNAKAGNGFTPLGIAIRLNQTEVVIKLLETGKINLESKIKALHVASYVGYQSIIDELLKSGIPVDSLDQNRTALMVAAHQGHTDVVRRLIRAGAQMETRGHDAATALILAAKAGSLGTMAKLIERGAQVNVHDSGGYGPIEWCNRQKSETNLAMLQAPLDEKFGKHLKEQDYTDICLLLKIYQEKVLAEYLKQPLEWTDQYIANVTKTHIFVIGSYKQTLLMWTCIFGHDPIALFLLHKCPIEEFINHRDTLGRTALMYALLYGHYDIARAFCELDERYYAQNKKHLVDVTAKDTYGNTALTYAVKAKNLALVHMLMQAGARVCVTPELIKYMAHEGYLKIMATMLCSVSDYAQTESVKNPILFK